MNQEQFIDQLETNGHSLEQLVAGVSDEQARWKPDDDTWSVLEVMNHMLFEERRDFRRHLARVFSTITYDILFPADEGKPSGLSGVLAAFLGERERSLAWLRSLDDPYWDKTIQMDWGQLKAGDMFASWVAHDVLHMRQLTELHYAYTVNQATPYGVRYAGEW